MLAGVGLVDLGTGIFMDENGPGLCCAESRVMGEGPGLVGFEHCIRDSRTEFNE